ncbi:hypothetical protein [Pseudomonas putida]|uniref:hypothetical protein n=1 Tax=Pseudomonas putida TaxID=303 RepID=UPI0016278A2D|nr:hypothetical protein [Pseudomonas putida]QNG10675.1 hypothetical protein GPM17_20570 [Pseudomonas putida]HDS1059375.1 hypothetical protein [Pseudomonas putida]
MSIDPRDLFVSLNPLGLDDRYLVKGSTGFADYRTQNDYLVFLAGYKAGAADGEKREFQRHRPINAEGCKPESSIHPSDTHCVGAIPCRSLDKAEGRRPDLIKPPHQGVAALREDIQRGNRIEIAMALDLSAIAEALGITPDQQQGGAAESIVAIKKLQVRLDELEQRHARCSQIRQQQKSVEWESYMANVAAKKVQQVKRLRSIR